jgi:hypothetical protein
MEYSASCIPPAPRWAGSEADRWVGFSVLTPLHNAGSLICDLRAVDVTSSIRGALAHYALRKT